MPDYGRAVHVFAAAYDTVLGQMESISPYALTSSVIAQDRAAIAHPSASCCTRRATCMSMTRPIAAFVGQQSFCGGRASGTNDKAGAAQNLLR
jgi:1-pyrroline-5-carboxylate dehydrogenase